MALGDGAKVPDDGRWGHQTGGVVGEGDDHGRQAKTLGHGIELNGIGNAADARQPNDVEAMHGGLGGVADPTGAGQRNTPALSAENGPQQRLAAGTGDNLRGLGRQAATGPVAGGGLTQRRNPGDGAVAGRASTRSQGRNKHRMHGKTGLAEAEGNDGQSGGAASGDDGIGGEGGGDGHTTQGANTRSITYSAKT